MEQRMMVRRTEDREDIDILVGLAKDIAATNVSVATCAAQVLYAVKTIGDLSAKFDAWTGLELRLVKMIADRDAELKKCTDDAVAKVRGENLERDERLSGRLTKIEDMQKGILGTLVTATIAVIAALAKTYIPHFLK